MSQFDFKKEEIDLSAEKENSIQIKEMENNWRGNEKMPMMGRLIIKMSGGLIKNERQAGYILLFFSIILIAVSLILLLNLKDAPKETFAPEAEAPAAEVKF